MDHDSWTVHDGPKYYTNNHVYLTGSTYITLIYYQFITERLVNDYFCNCYIRWRVVLCEVPLGFYKQNVIKVRIQGKYKIVNHREVNVLQNLNQLKYKAT